jgi:transposase
MTLKCSGENADSFPQETCGGPAVKAYSTDLRERVLACCDAGTATSEVAERFSVSTARVRRLKQRRREGKGTAPLTRRSRPAGRAARADDIRAAVARTPDATLAELRDARHLSFSTTTLCRALRVLRLPLKKSR